MGYAVTDPATGEVVQTYPTTTDAEIEAALAAASTASKDWARNTTVAERAALVGRVADLFDERKDELGALISREMGKPLEDAVGEAEFAGAIFRYYADNAEALLADQPIELSDGEGTALVRHAPLGVLVGVMPWNFPYYQVARFAGPALCVGNPVIIKHASQCPQSSAAIQKIHEDAGFPAGAFTNVYASTAQVSAMIADPRTVGVSLTGSEGAGIAVAEVAAKNLKKVVLELGGADPFIVLSTDDLDATVADAVAARMDNTGQSCNGAKRFVVIADLYDAFVEKFTAGLKAAAEGIAPLSSVGAADFLGGQVDAAVAAGARFESSGERTGAFFPAGVLTDVTGPARHEELFGPVAMVFKVSSEDEAVAVANDTPFGLGSYLYTTDREQADRVANQIEAGMVYINCVLADAAELPFGGIKRSGFGRELGYLGIEEFVNKKLIRSVF
ncbi:MAG: aldehyde dehydrogenase family protein [Cellulomonas sp.]|jgi:succinate-semialdehyde dehydrogenase/glutarate-semialdehyde dehydrogenase|nr:aldehyde dehydrogenase family protein [Cellulomonas sp.]